MSKKTPPKSSHKKTEQLGWADWLSSSVPPVAQTEKAPPAPARASAAAASLPQADVKKRDWSKLKFPPSEGPILSSATSSADKSGADSSDEPVESEPAIITVSGLNKMIRGKLETEFHLVWLKGEISNFKPHPSGHFYFSLKDSTAQISAVMFRGFNSTLRFIPEDGMEVVVRGKVTVYEPRGNYQIMCELMEPVGAGALQRAFEQLKRKLEAEGLFASARKRPIPMVPKHIALVTSPSGAAIRDMLNVLGRRYKAAQITVVPCSVQGERAPREIVAAMALANRLTDVDVIIVGRGGGSIEDLWAFNEEIVARAIATSRVPVISAVGHEVDFTIADFVADLRAPTPSAAAELVAKSAVELVDRVRALERALAVSWLSRLNRAIDRVRTAGRLLVDPRRRIEDAILRCDELGERMERAVLEAVDRAQLMLNMSRERLDTRVCRRVEVARERLVRAGALLDSVSPLRVLDRGYAVATVAGRVLTDAKDIKPETDFEVRVAKGVIYARVRSVEKAKE